VSANFIWINVISTVCNVLGNIKQTGKSSEDIGVGYSCLQFSPKQHILTFSQIWQSSHMRIRKASVAKYRFSSNACGNAS
jgi:hypothetical protein